MYPRWLTLWCFAGHMPARSEARRVRAAAAVRIVYIRFRHSGCCSACCEQHAAPVYMVLMGGAFGSFAVGCYRDWRRARQNSKGKEPEPIRNV
jgi:hypothetical protein